MKLPAISKNEFMEAVTLLREQEKKDMEFADFMEKYLDGRFVPTISDCASKAAMKLLALAFDDRSENTWIEWFAYENDWGEKMLQVKLNSWKRWRRIKTPERMYDFLVEWMNEDK